MANEISAYIPITNIYDPSYIEELQISSPEFKIFLSDLNQQVNDICGIMNMKDSAYYITDEFICGQVFFPNPTNPVNDSAGPAYRPVFRKVVNVGQLNNGIATTRAHNITVSATTTFTRIYGVASKSTAVQGFVPLPYINTSGTYAFNIELRVDATNVIITPSAASAAVFDNCYVILEYLQN